MPRDYGGIRNFLATSYRTVFEQSFVCCSEEMQSNAILQVDFPITIVCSRHSALCKLISVGPHYQV